MYLLLPALVFVVCALLIWPVVESGVMDDWSIVHTAQVLAQTGHLRFNGWESPTLAWLPYSGALLAKIFGPGYATFRWSMVGFGALTILLLQPVLVRGGLDRRTAAFGAATLAVSPVFLVNSLTYMTDIPGLLAILICLYSCLRAVREQAPQKAAVWMAVASVGTALVGSVRQSAWIPVFIMVPCALWLVRRRRPVLLAGVVAWGVSLGFIVVVMHWFKQQPYVLPVEIIPGHIGKHQVGMLGRLLFRSPLDLLLLILPVPLAFAGAFGKLPAKQRLWLGVGAALAVAALLVDLKVDAHPSLAPFLLYGFYQQTMENTFTNFVMPVLGPAPALLGTGFRVVVSVLVIVAVLALVAAYLRRRSLEAAADEASRAISWHDLLVLVLPFSAVYYGILLPRRDGVFYGRPLPAAAAADCDSAAAAGVDVDVWAGAALCGGGTGAGGGL